MIRSVADTVGRGLPKLAFWWTLVVLTWASACDRDQPKSPTKEAPPADTGAPPVGEWTAPTPADLVRADDISRRPLELSNPRRFPDCHVVFEPDGGPPADDFPLKDSSMRSLTLAGCKPEAYRVTDAGTRLVAYATPTDEPGWDMRLAAWAANGDLLWHQRMDRSENGANFTANFRGSFIAPLLPRLVCAGTLWAGGTQAMCVAADTGEPKWRGMMKFWSGIAPQPRADGLNGATISGLSRRYPFSGVEMRYEAFRKSGGRAAFYATDGHRLFFVPAEGKHPTMWAYDLASFEPLWRLKLPAHPRPGWTHAFAETGVVLFKIDAAIYGVNADNGHLRWAAHVGGDTPPIVELDHLLYILLRRDAKPNLLFEINPSDGQINWKATVPTGTLDVLTYDDDLVLRSVRAVQKVIGFE